MRLNKDNSFILYYEAGKGSESIKGKYQIEDNNITLTPSKNNIYKFITDTLHGKVGGKRIKLAETKIGNQEVEGIYIATEDDKLNLMLGEQYNMGAYIDLCVNQIYIRFFFVCIAGIY